MSTINITNQDRQHGYIVVTWEALGNADEGEAYIPPTGYDLVSAQFTGTFSSATVKVQGTIDGTNFSDVESTGLTAAGLITPAHQTLSFRPETTGGSSADIDASFLFKAIN